MNKDVLSFSSQENVMRFGREENVEWLSTVDSHECKTEGSKGGCWSQMELITNKLHFYCGLLMCLFVGMFN